MVKVQRLGRTNRQGIAEVSWVDQGGELDRVPCRLDLNFLRPGKDLPPPQEGPGVAPDRYGVLFCDAIALRAGDRIVAVPNDYGETPIAGTFTIQAIPDFAQNFAHAHHIEVQITETAQDLGGKFSGVR